MMLPEPVRPVSDKTCRKDAQLKLVAACEVALLQNVSRLRRIDPTFCLSGDAVR